MNQFKRTQVIMLPTKNKSLLHINYSKLQLNKFEKLDANNQHLYIISDDEIKEGDWCIEFDLSFKPIEIFKCNGIIPGECIIRKIIASTNMSLRIESELDVYYKNGIGGARSLPQPSQQFIEKYIESYNKGEVITDVLIEYETNYKWSTSKELIERSMPGLGYREVGNGFIEDGLKLKVNPKDNTITIKKLKDSWSREEVIELLNKRENYLNERSLDNQSRIDNWIKENL